jgi:hypothetical protein
LRDYFEVENDRQSTQNLFRENILQKQMKKENELEIYNFVLNVKVILGEDTEQKIPDPENQ